MKMICPHCGVKGSADESLLQRKVKCPKCSGIFEVNADVVTAIPVKDIELEQLETTPLPEEELGLETEVDDVFNDIFGEDDEEASLEEMEEGELESLIAGEMEDDGEAPIGQMEEGELESLIAGEMEEDSEVPIGQMEESEIDSLLSGEMEDDEEELIAALSDYDEYKTPVTDSPVQDDGEVDSTLTVIEDFSEESLESEEEIPTEIAETDELAFLDDDGGAEESEEPTLDFDTDISEELWADQKKTVVAEDEDMLLPDESDDEGHEEVDIWANESDDGLFTDGQEDADAEETELTIEEAEAELELAAEDAEEEGEESEEETTDEEQLLEDDSVIQKCSACGEYVDQNVKYKLGSNVYCDKCVPRRERKTEHEKVGAAAAALVASSAAAATAEQHSGKFTISTLIKDSWYYTKGVKGSIWGAMIIMSLLMIGIGVGTVFLLQQLISAEGWLQVALMQTGVQLFFGILSFVMSAGILLIAIKKIAGQPFSWKMVFSGFKKMGSLALLYILQLLMIAIGFCLLILPGIYLSVGYMLSLPLVIARGMSPWQALEASRKAIHTRWWTVFFSFIVMSIIMTVSAVPLGLGLIWTIPMFMVFIGILYYHFFGGEEE